MLYTLLTSTGGWVVLVHIFPTVARDLMSSVSKYLVRWQVEGLNIPMSVGPPSVDKDNAGEECVVYDVIINPKVRIGSRLT